MTRIPTLKTVSKSYATALSQGQGIGDLPPIEQVIAMYTPIGIFKAWQFRNHLSGLIRHGRNTLRHDMNILDFAHRYATPRTKQQLIKLLYQAIPDNNGEAW